MPFVPHVVQVKPARSVVAVSLKKKYGGPAQVMVSLSAATAADIGWSRGDLIVVLLGTEEQHGLVRLNKGANGTTEVKTGAGKGRLRISLGHIETFVDRDEPSQDCSYKKVDSWVEIVLPEWASETNPGRRSTAAAPRSSLLRDPPPNSTLRPRLGVRMTSVRQSPVNFGDPAPGRSALHVDGIDRAKRQADLARADKEIRLESEAFAREERHKNNAGKATREFRVGGQQLIVLRTLLDAQPHQGEELRSLAKMPTVGAAMAVISMLRAKLSDHGITIDNVRGGYVMAAEMAAKARHLVEGLAS